MGTSCNANITINFEKETPNEFMDRAKLRQALVEFYASDPEHTDKLPYFCIQGYDARVDSVGFDMDSSRTKNLVFQVDTLIAYIKAKGYKIIEFSSSAYMAMDSATYYLEQYEIDEM